DAVPAAGRPRTDRRVGATGTTRPAAAGASSLRADRWRAAVHRPCHRGRLRVERAEPQRGTAVDRRTLSHRGAQRADRASGAVSRGARVLQRRDARGESSAPWESTGPACSWQRYPTPRRPRRMVRVARGLNPGVHIIARTRYVVEIPELIRLGANDVIPEEFETSIEIFARV